MKALFILALIGSVCTLQYPVEYHYQYSGRLATGIPGIKPQVSATAIKAKVIVQMKSQSQALVKLSDIEVGHFNGDAKCVQLRKPLPIPYAPLTKYATELQEPFGVNFAEEMGHVMTVPKSDVEFITNIRKSIVEILRVSPITGRLNGAKRDPIVSKMSEESSIKVYSEQEETIFGRCENQYTLTPLPEHLAREEIKEIEKHLTKDEQLEGSAQRTSLPKLENRLYRLIKAVSFDKCHEPVILTHAGVSNFSEAGHGQFESVQSRSSVSSYILRGHENNYRIERAIIEGDVILNPFGYKMNRLHAITNQTLTLEAVQSIKTSLRLPTPSRNVKTWRYEVASPFEAPAGSPRVWVNYHSKGDRFAPVPSYAYLLGIFPTQRITEQYKSAIKHILDEVVDEIETVPEPPHTSNSDPSSHRGAVATSKVYAISKMMRSLHVKDVEEIFSEVFQENDRKGEIKQMILVDITAASGAAAPMKVLLEKIRSGHISSTRAATIFTTLTNHMISPVLIPELMKYAMSMDVDRNPFLASAVLINFATLAHRMCLSHSAWNYSIPNPVFGKEVCKAGPIISDFLPYLTNKATSASKEWHKAIYIEAASNLGSAHVISALRSIITGEVHVPKKARLLSIFALSRRKIPASANEEVFDVLMRVVDNLSEEPEIRQAAVTALLSWHPDVAWWQRLARLTWREPVESMAAFFTFTAEKVAFATDPHLRKQANIAAFVLPLMKPFSPSIRYSYNNIYSRYDPVSKMVLNANVGFIEDLESVIPADIYVALKNSFGGFTLTLFEGAISSEGLHIPIYSLIDIYNRPKSDENKYSASNPRDVSSRQAHHIREQTKTELGRDEHEEGRPEANIFVRVMDNMRAFLPLTSETIRKGSEKMVRELIKGKKVRATKYFNPIEVQFSVPTEIGLPVLCTAALPTINVVEGEVKLETDDESSDNPSISDILRSRHTRLLFKSNYRLMSKLMVNLTVPVPWEENVIEAGVQTFREVNLPIYGNLSVTNTHEIKNVTFNLSPYHRREFPVVYAYNIPYSVIRPLVPTENGKNDLKIIASTRQRKPLVERETKLNEKLTGLKATLKYAGDVPYPFTTSFLLDYLRRPTSFAKLLASPTSKQWQVAANLDPSQSSTKNISVSLTYVSAWESEDDKEESRTKSSSKLESNLPDFSATDSQRQRIEKLKEFASGNLVRAINAQLFFNGSEFRKYEALLGLALKNSPEDSEKEYKSLIAVMSEQGEGAEPKAYCLGVDMRTPGITDFERLKEAVSSGPKESIRGELYYGRSCSSRAIASFEGEAKMSSERQREVTEELEEVCNFDERNPVVEMQTAAVYDEGKLEIRYKKSEIPAPMMNLTYAVEHLLYGYVWPKASFNKLNVNNEEGRLKVEAKRPLSTKHYTFWAQKPKENVIAPEIPVSDFLTRIIPFTGLKVQQGRYSGLILSREMPSTCRITSNQVTTYDRLNYNFEPLNCYTVAAVRHKTTTDFIIHTRKHSEESFEARISLPISSVVVILTKNSAIINGKPMSPHENKKIVKDPKGQVVMIIFRHANYFEANVEGKLDVTVAKEVHITPSLRLKNDLRGLCGDFDGNTQYDLTGPKNCLYSDQELFKFAWTISDGDDCDTAQLQEEKEKVHQFQERCPKRPTRQTFSSMQLNSEVGDKRKASECYFHVYPVQEERGHKGGACAATEPVQRCKVACRLTNKRVVPRPAKCWDRDHVPSDVKEALETGYTLAPVPEPGQYHRILNVMTAKKCEEE